MQFKTEEKDLMSISWGGLFLVTGICMLIFSVLVKWLEGESSPLLVKIGTASLTIGVLRVLLKWIR